mmetsp:Transcript_2760/g.4487  ORF Transcript_2760/g.4487 Transcript_2760/m.4487 type:complete len:524 (-) Transcript_2760:240-1811(-)|eukprot:CAMPEP_0184297582 /NCGR_PEP_ID=MMETSP1049-20130417/8474_1 /TAXON_ID=77928 /ORGANISM="Proteomonas sulcata, Strain CCMP704" /LENGTH=523 /DNA_ID=CAMNT_0026607371 /DNA_START=95 /DNA_END=1666 /DNA_ORIENTATION=-
MPVGISRSDRDIIGGNNSTFLKQPSIPKLKSAQNAIEVPPSQEAQEAYAKKLQSKFPGSVPEHVFIEHASKVLHEKGFTPETSINLVSNCRDEICRPFVECLDRQWGSSFNISSLGGMVFCGKTGFKAAMAHSPIVDGKERYVIWVAPHVAIPQDGDDGKVYRSGRENASTACGALLALLAEIKSGKLSLQLEPSDLEHSLLKQKVLGQLRYGHVPNLVEITHAAHKVILADSVRTATSVVSLEKSEYVIISGIQIHGPMGQNYFWPGSFTSYSSAGIEDLIARYESQSSNGRVEQCIGSDALATLQNREHEALRAAGSGNLGELLRAEVPLDKVRDNGGRSVLHIAARKGRIEVVKYLLERQDSWPDLIEAKDLQERTALEHAVMHSHDRVAEEIKAQGRGLSGGWLQEQMLTAVKGCMVEEVRRLFLFAENSSEAATAADSEGKSLIAIVSESNHPRRAEMMQFLISNGAETAGVDYYGNSATRTLTKSNSRTDLQEVLINAGVDVRPMINGIGRSVSANI